MNPFDKYPAIRAAFYTIQWLVTGAQTVIGAFFAFEYGTPENWPHWFLAFLAVAPVFWAYFGRTAQVNVAPNEPLAVKIVAPEQDEQDEPLPFDDEVSGNGGDSS